MLKDSNLVFLLQIRGGGGLFSAIRVDIRRDNILHSAFEALHNYRSELKKDVKVVFISEQGTQVNRFDNIHKYANYYYYRKLESMGVDYLKSFLIL